MLLSEADFKEFSVEAMGSAEVNVDLTLVTSASVFVLFVTAIVSGIVEICCFLQEVTLECG